VPLLDAQRIDKSYPGVRALAGVDLSVDPGEVHALVGENGAGKSTLMKVIAGSVTPERGRLVLDGSELSLGDADANRDRGIGIVYQELSLVPQRSVAENVMMGRWPRTRLGTISWKRLRPEARRHLDRVGLAVDEARPVGELGMAARQQVELAKALSTDVRVLLLDEPTSALSERETRRLFEIIGELKSAGVAILYVSHRLREILEIADRITVLRDGSLVDTVPAAGADEGRLAQMMVGRRTGVDETAAGGTRPPDGAPVALRARGLARPPRLMPVDLELREGEIVAVFGLVGAGRTRLARTLFGLERAAEGTLEIGGRALTIDSPAAAIGAGMGYVGEDRTAGLVPRLSVAANITLASLSEVARGPVMDFGSERDLARRYFDELSIRAASIDQPVESLSGGNQQKVVLARWTCSQARVLILDDPTRGIDVGAKEEVFRLVRELSARGVATLYLTSELREARMLAHRVLVMSGGRVVREFPPETEEDEIMAAAGGAHV
jgi:ABC-type sugar transport system ATPase subunit